MLTQYLRAMGVKNNLINHCSTSGEWLEFMRSWLHQRGGLVSIDADLKSLPSCNELLRTPRACCQIHLTTVQKILAEHEGFLRQFLVDDKVGNSHTQHEGAFASFSCLTLFQSVSTKSRNCRHLLSLSQWPYGSPYHGIGVLFLVVNVGRSFEK